MGRGRRAGRGWAGIISVLLGAVVVAGPVAAAEVSPFGGVADALPALQADLCAVQARLEMLTTATDLRDLAGRRIMARSVRPLLEPWRARVERWNSERGDPELGRLAYWAWSYLWDWALAEEHAADANLHGDVAEGRRQGWQALSGRSAADMTLARLAGTVGGGCAPTTDDAGPASCAAARAVQMVADEGLDGLASPALVDRAYDLTRAIPRSDATVSLRWQLGAWLSLLLADETGDRATRARGDTADSFLTAGIDCQWPVLDGAPTMAP